MLKSLISEDEFLQRACAVPLQRVEWCLARQNGIEVLVRRDDLIDGDLSGNKFYKLFYNLQIARQRGYKKLLSFGGAYSNHIYALAAAGQRFGFESIGVIRGERPQILSPTLNDAQKMGMRLHFATRTEYRELSTIFLEKLRKSYGDFYMIPEGGANAEGMAGTRIIGWAIQEQLASDYAAVCVPCGTGNTLAGIASGVFENTSSGKNNLPVAIGFSVLKGAGELGKQIGVNLRTYSSRTNNWRLISGYDCGGYGKKLPVRLQGFIRDTEYEIGLQLDPVYTVKMFWGVAQLIQRKYWPVGTRLVLVHTGGLQGRRGFKL